MPTDPVPEAEEPVEKNGDASAESSAEPVNTPRKPTVMENLGLHRAPKDVSTPWTTFMFVLLFPVRLAWATVTSLPGIVTILLLIGVPFVIAVALRLLKAVAMFPVRVIRKRRENRAE